ncbi:MAG: hypothetical protein JWN86_4251 [Planctomycetota bacterium]|nr:hypothetical protein [Planctomycetota bacterium]
MSGSLVADLGIGPEVWLFLAVLGCLTLFFKFSRFWSIRNLDLVLLFAPVPGLMRLVGGGTSQPWGAFAWLFIGSGLWLIRCLVDLGLTRRPHLEPNLTFSGLACLSVGMLGLLLMETVSLPTDQGSARNPADPRAKPNEAGEPKSPEAAAGAATVKQVLDQTPLPTALKRKPPQVIVARVVAGLAHLGLVFGLMAVGWKHFERPIAGMAVATCYLILPYTRIALVDGGQLVPAALIVAAVLAYRRPALAGLCLGLAVGWMPAAIGLLPLWAGFFWGRGIGRFSAAAILTLAICGAVAWNLPELTVWGRELGARSLAEVGLHPGVEAPSTGSFWTRIDPSYRLPVLIAYLALSLATAAWPGDKNLGELIALSAALLVASQFWYLVEGGTLVLMYLPLVLLMVFRPNLSAKRPPVIAPRVSHPQLLNINH